MKNTEKHTRLPSAREFCQMQLVSAIKARRDIFNAPYGVIAGLSHLGRGKVRNVTFGIARRLDAHAEIFTPNHLSVTATGSLAPHVDGVFTSVDELVERLDSLRRYSPNINMTVIQE